MSVNESLLKGMTRQSCDPQCKDCDCEHGDCAWWETSSGVENIGKPLKEYIDQLKARAAELESWLEIANRTATIGEYTPEIKRDVVLILNRTPAQSLNRVKAEALREASWMLRESSDVHPADRLIEHANRLEQGVSDEY